MPGAEMSGDSVYVHGTDPEEQHRLAELNRLLNAACLREAGIVAGERVLDVGAGLGQLARAMAQAAGLACVAIERSPDQLAEARRIARAEGEEVLIDLREGDALALPLQADEWGTFDVAHARFLLEHVHAPAVVVEQMVRAVRPGGRIILCDDDHSLLRLHPEPPGVREVWDAFVRTYERNGNDPFVGRRLTSLLTEAGAAPRRATWIFFGACAGEDAFPAFAANLAGNLSGARDAIRAMGMNGAAVDRAVASIASFARRPDAMIGYAMPWAEGIRAA
jgi:ubiquinone/menaquinone biosynthesis C-methylase UbiE